MYTDNAYLNNSLIDIKDKSKPLIVTSCGTYKLYSRPKLPTWRPKGRVDFQLLYIAAGKAHFHIDSEEKIVHATPMQYILSKRIYNAVVLLHDTQYNITEIAAIVGYDNPLYFSRIFKKQKGLSPSEYRKSIEKQL